MYAGVSHSVSTGDNYTVVNQQETDDRLKENDSLGYAAVSKNPRKHLASVQVDPHFRAPPPPGLSASAASRTDAETRENNLKLLLQEEQAMRLQAERQYQKNIGDANKIIEELTRAKVLSEVTAKHLAEQNRGYDIRLDEVERRRQLAVDQSHHLAQQGRGYDMRIDELEEKYRNDTNAITKEAHAKINEMKGHIDELKAKMSEAEIKYNATVADFKRKENDMENRLKMAEQHLETIRKERDVVSEQLRNEINKGSETDTTRQTALTVAALKDRDQLRAQLDAATNQIAQLTTEIGQAQSAFEDCNGQKRPYVAPIRRHLTTSRTRRRR